MKMTTRPALTPRQKTWIYRAYWNGGTTLRELGKRFHVRPATISEIVSPGQPWLRKEFKEMER